MRPGAGREKSAPGFRIESVKGLIYMAFEVRSQTLGNEMIVGSFRPNGASAIDATQSKGSGFSVTRTGVGAFSIVVPNRLGKGVIAVSTHLRMAVPDGSVARAGAFVSATNTLSVITLTSGGAPVDIASNVDNVCSFTIHIAS